VIQTIIEQLERIRPTAIAELKEGLAAVEGRAVPLAPFASPVSGVPAIAMVLVLELELGDDTHRRYELSEASEFAVEDASGRVHVSPGSAHLLLDVQYRQGNGEAGSLAADVLRYARSRVELPAMAFRSFSWREAFLEPGEQVLVCGELRRVIDPGGASSPYRQNALRPTFVAAAGRPLVIADRRRADLLPSLRLIPRRGTPGPVDAER